MIRITIGKQILSDCESIIIVPEKAVEEAGYIQVFTVKDNAYAKHEYHAMAQMAYFQYQDGELELIEVVDPLEIALSDGECVTVEAGLVLSRHQGGEFSVFIHSHQNKKKLLESAYRYCTRWVRLDI